MFVPITEKIHAADPHGIHQIYQFSNGRGASVVRFRGSYGYSQGLWELAEIFFHSEDPNDWDLLDPSEVQDYLTWAEVIGILASIEKKPDVAYGIIDHTGD